MCYLPLLSCSLWGESGRCDVASRLTFAVPHSSTFKYRYVPDKGFNGFSRECPWGRVDCLARRELSRDSFFRLHWQPSGSRFPDFSAAVNNTSHPPLIHCKFTVIRCPPLQLNREKTASNMSSPSKRSTRSSATPGRATRSSQRSSPAAGPSNAAERTPRQARPSQLASSPLFYQSSSPAPGANTPSSPLRQMSNSQSTANHAPSSPLRQQTETQSAGDRTPRASGALIGGGIYHDSESACA